MLDLGDGWALLHIDRHLLHDLSGPPALQTLADRGLALADPELVCATVDHAVSSAPGRTGMTYPAGGKLWAALKAASNEAGIRFFDVDQDGQGIVHVMGPELGLALPGTTLICSDSHTCTNGALGALALGVGQTESAHALATSTLRLQKPKQMRITLHGSPAFGVTAKDLIPHVIGKLGVAAGVGYAIEYAGAAVAQMSIEARLTLCNLSVELGARCGIVAPDDITFAYLRGRRFAPNGKLFDQAQLQWQLLFSDPDAGFDREETVDISDVPPTVTWGVTPEHTVAIGGRMPDTATIENPDERAAIAAALDYMGLEAGH